MTRYLLLANRLFSNAIRSDCMFQTQFELQPCDWVSRNQSRHDWSGLACNSLGSLRRERDVEATLITIQNPGLLLFAANC